MANELQEVLSQFKPSDKFYRQMVHTSSRVSKSSSKLIATIINDPMVDATKCANFLVDYLNNAQDIELTNKVKRFCIELVDNLKE